MDSLVEIGDAEHQCQRWNDHFPQFIRFLDISIFLSDLQVSRCQVSAPLPARKAAGLIGKETVHYRAKTPRRQDS
jgi:hypothetical protein